MSILGLITASVETCVYKLVALSDSVAVKSVTPADFLFGER